MLDNCSRDGSAQAAGEHPAVDETIALPERRGKAANDSELLRRARGRYALLLNEDSELRPGATLALWRGARAAPRRGLRGRAGCCAPTGAPRRARGAFPPSPRRSRARSCCTACCTVQSTGTRTREVDWCQSSALLVRREAAAAGGLPRPRLLRVLRRGRLRPPPARPRLAQRVRAGRAGGPPRAALHRRAPGAADRRTRPQARPVHAQAPLRRERPRVRLADRLELRAARAGRARPARARSSKRYWRHVTASLHPERGEGLREAAAEFNRAAPAGQDSRRRPAR